MTRLVQVLAIALAAALVVKVLAWAVAPLIPLLAVLLVVAGLCTLAAGGFRRL